MTEVASKYLPPYIYIYKLYKCIKMTTDDKHIEDFLSLYHSPSIYLIEKKHHKADITRLKGKSGTFNISIQYCLTMDS